MAKPKGRPKGKAAEQEPRSTVINLKGTQEQVEWLESAHRKTYLPKAVIVRLALDLWAEKNGIPPLPTLEEDR